MTKFPNDRGMAFPSGPTDRPAPYQVPDRQEWERQHGTAPVKLAAHASLVRSAKIAVERDWSELDPKAVFKLQAWLDGLCETAANEAGTGEGIVHFDAQEQAFYEYLD